MRIQFVNADFQSSSGPNCFATCLAKQLYNTGHEVTFDFKGADASLVFIENPQAQTLAEPIVQRIDGIWSGRGDFENFRNYLIQHMYDISHACVFQSKFDERVVTGLLGAHDHSIVIHNGTDAPPILNSTHTGLEAIRQQYDVVYCCSANWHRQKRLKENVELFTHLRSLRPTVKQCLIVLGDHPDHVVADHDIFYAGSQPLDVCIEVYSMSDYMLHLAHGDHCPNVVIHALSQETPVVCTEHGGTREIVGAYGCVLREEREFEYGKMYDFDDPPPLDVKQVLELPLRNQLGLHEDVTIETTAQKYVELFTKLKKK